HRRCRSDEAVVGGTLGRCPADRVGMAAHDSRRRRNRRGYLLDHRRDDRAVGSRVDAESSLAPFRQHSYCRGAPPPRRLAASLRSRLASGGSLRSAAALANRRSLIPDPVVTHAGSSIVKTAPPPLRFAAATVPPCSSIRCFTIAR